MKKINKLEMFAFSAIALGTTMLSQDANAQSWQRVYANAQTNNDGPGAIFVTVSDSLNAVGSTLQTYSNLNFTVAGEATQRLTFPESPGTNPIHVKIGKGASILDVIPTITVTAYNASNVPVGSQTVGALLGALKGASEADIVINPTGTAASVEVSYSGISLGTGVRVYAAYFDKPATTDTLYNKPLDILSSSNGALGGGVLSSVTSPSDAIDGDENTFASINKLADALNSNYLTALYSSKSAAGDTVRLVLNNPGSLLTLDLLSSGLSVSTFNGNTETNIFSDASLLNLRLLPGATDKYILSIPTINQFDRIRIGTGGTLSTTYGLNVYEIGRKIPSVGFAQDTVVYDGTALPILTADLPNATDTVVWYATETSIGEPLATGLVYALPSAPTVSTNYYAFVKRNGTVQPSSVGAVYVQVKIVYLKPMAFLEGAYRPTGSMTTILSDNELLPVTFGGVTVLNVNSLEVDDKKVVDWVTVELRQATSGAALIESQSGLLLSDGKIIPASTLADSFQFKALPGEYIVAIKHRSHLGAATKSLLSSTSAMDVNLSAISTTTTAQQTTTGLKMLHTGNYDGNSEINGLDYTGFASDIFSGLRDDRFNADFDFNTEVNGLDYTKFAVKIFSGLNINYGSL